MDKLYVTSHALTLPQLYIRFPAYKYLQGRKFLEEKPTTVKYICARMLSYFLKVVFWDIAQNQITLKFPPGSNASFEMENISDEEFKKAVQNGAYRYIDFLKSNFSVNIIVFKYHTRYGNWIRQVHVGGELRKAVIESVYKRSVHHKETIKNVSDYLDILKERFPIYTKFEIYNIINYGLRIYAWAMRMHADIHTLNSSVDKYTFYNGWMSDTALKTYKIFVTKWRMKERVLFYLREEQWDGYYYIGLTEAKHKKIKAGGKFKNFEKVFAVKLIRELYHDKAVKHIWRIPYTIDAGWKFYLPDLKTDKAEYIGPNKYEIYNKCFLGRYGSGSSSAEHSE